MLLNGVLLLSHSNFKLARVEDLSAVFTEYFGSAQRSLSGHSEFSGLFINTKFYLSSAILYWPVGLVGFVLFLKI